MKPLTNEQLEGWIKSCVKYENEKDFIKKIMHGHVIRIIDPGTIKSMATELLEARKVIQFYSTFSPVQHPEGYYEIHIAPGEGGEVRFGTRGRAHQEKWKAAE